MTPTLDTTTILLAAAILIVVVLIGWIIRLEIRLNRFLTGKGAMSLEEVFEHTKKRVADLEVFNKEMQKYLTKVEMRLKQSVQGIETVRFNAFKGTGEGGNQSFATALLTERGNGVIISTLYSRERTSVFSKPIVDFKATVELTEEEKQVLLKARESLE